MGYIMENTVYLLPQENSEIAQHVSNEIPQKPKL